MAQKAPLIVILGATACGKSRLAIELARRFRGEIISADSMQVYKGLDIVTNKVTEEEQQQATHHMINFVDPLSRYSVIDFRNKSLNLINQMHKKQFLPIVVGGTNYYIESLLWKSFILGPSLKSAKRGFEQPDSDSYHETLIDSEAKILESLDKETLHTPEDFDDIDKFLSKPIYNEAFSETDCQKLWQILEKLDPKSAHRTHPHDKRRVIRSLQIIQESKRNYSDILEEKNVSETRDHASLGGPLRYEATLVIWLNCDNSILDKVLDERVDAMLNRGLLAELESFHDSYNKQRLIDGKEPDYEKGVFQTIGFKEFHTYFMLDSDTRQSETGNKVLKQAIDRMKISTRQYARRQLKWIRRRFLQSGTRDLPPVFRLETSFDEQGWLDSVQSPAYNIVSCFLESREIPADLLVYKEDPEKQGNINTPGKLHCEICDRVLIGSHHITEHLRSKPHQRNLARAKKIKHQPQHNETTTKPDITESSNNE